MNTSSLFAPAIRGALVVVNASARRHGRFVVSAALVLGLGACAEVQLAAYTAKEIVATVERPEPEGVYKVGDAYQVDGAWYTPAVDTDYDEVGVASWYGEQFHGRSTANGSVYDMNALTAAHKTLPMPSQVRVTNLDNGRSLTLTVNDRGPFVRGRVIDVSRRASQLLGFYRRGTARVRVQAMSGADPVPLIVLAAAETAIAPLELTAPAAAPEAVTEEPLQVIDFAAIPPEPATPDVLETARGAGEADAIDTAPVPEATAAAAAATREPLNVVDLTRDFVKPAPPAASEPATPELLPAIAAFAGPAEPAPMAAPAAVDREPLPAIARAAEATPAVAVARYIQAGAFTNVGNARRLSARLARFGSARMTRAMIDGREFYRVRVGPIATIEETDAILERIIAAGHPGALMVVD